MLKVIKIHLSIWRFSKLLSKYFLQIKLMMYISVIVILSVTSLTGVRATNVTCPSLKPDTSIWALNYSGPLYKVSGNFTAVSWLLGKGVPVVLPCKEQTTTAELTSNCKTQGSNKNVSTFYVKNLTTNVWLTVEILPNVCKLNKSLAIFECTTSLPLQVRYSNAPVQGTFNTLGNFHCSNNGTLVYSNGSKPASNYTKCQANAMWKGQKDLECVLVELNGKNNYTLNSTNKGTTDFYCSVAGNNSAITNGDLTLQVNNQAKLPNFQIQSIDHGKEVQCRLSWQSTGTEILSAATTLIVNYVPFWLNGNRYNCPSPCSFQFRSNPQASWALYKQGENITSKGNVAKISSGNWSFSTDEPTSNATYTLQVSNGVGSVNFSFVIGDPLPPTTPPMPQPLPIAAIAGAAGAAVVILIIVLAVLFYRRRNKEKDEKEVRENPLYGSAQNAGGNGAVDPEANKQKKKTKEMKVNVAYQPASPDVIEDAYGGVNTGEREMKDNILYGSSGPSAQPMEDAYAEVNKGKKNKKGKKEMKVNVAYVPTPENPDAPEEAYAAVDKTKKNKGKKQKPEKEMKDNILYATSQAGGSMDDAYAQVDKGKKEAGNSYGESSQGATYSEVNKPKKKNKQPPPPTSPTQDDDPYAEVDLHGQENN
uniref:Uncharacterized protein LOC100180909 n=1 Tax=Phallusia mammillata TaxID=59560 RepID=A0A6F9DHW0_9ASCI|nr:uncharacterized protein LOC100180909 [Phallusia mammillata]